MRKQTRRKLMAGILAAVMMLTSVPETVYAIEQADRTEQENSAPVEAEINADEKVDSEEKTESETSDEKNDEEENKAAAPDDEIDKGDVNGEEISDQDNAGREENESETLDGEDDGEETDEVADSDSADNTKKDDVADEDGLNTEDENDLIEEEEIADVRIYNAAKSVIGDDYPVTYKNAAINAIKDEWNFYNRQCTSFVAWRLNSQNGVGFKNSYRNPRCNCGDESQNKWGHAYHWGCAARSVGITVDNTPSVGSVWWSSGGHVAWVAEVNGSQVTIEEYNYVDKNNPVPGKYHYRIVSASSATGYIHIGELTPPQLKESIRTIPDGDYQIIAGADGNKCLTIDCQSTVNGANAQIYPSIGDANQVFHVEWLGDSKGYKITYKNSGKSLTVDGDGDEKQFIGQNVDQWEWYENTGQMWVISGTGDGQYYTVQARCSGYYLQVNGTNVRMWNEDGNNTKWKFVPFTPLVSDDVRTISDGDYHIVSALSGGNYQNPGQKCLTIGGLPGAKDDNMAEVELWSVFGMEDHVFTVEYHDVGNYVGYYTIKLKDSANKYLDVPGGFLDRGTRLHQYERNDSTAQQWIIKETGDEGVYTIQSKCNGWYVDVEGAATGNGTDILLWEENGTNAQKWYFVPWGGGDSAKQEIPDGEYQIVPKLDNNKAINAAGDGTTDGTNICLWSCLGDERHTFNVEWLGNGYYEIIHKNSGLALDQDVGGNKNVQLWSQSHLYNQQWIIRSCGDGYFNVISRCNGLYLDLNMEETDNGTNIGTCVGWERDGGLAQKWKFIPYEGKNVDIEQIKLDKVMLTLPVGGQEKLTAVISPENATDKTFTWKSSDVSVAEVSDSGVVTAIEAGAAIITVETGNGKIASCQIIVEEEKLFTVTFDSNGGSEVESQQVESGKTVTEPQESVREGFWFVDWYLDGEPYDFNTPVSRDITLAAVWEEDKGGNTDPSKSFTVTFNSNGGSGVESQRVESGRTLMEPQEPVREGFLFVGWYLDGEPYDFNTPVSRDITLAAVWEESGAKEGLWFSTILDQIYTGSAIKPVVKVYYENTPLKEKTDYTITYKNNKNANDASAESSAPTVIVKGKGSYTGKETMTFKILPRNLADGVIDVSFIDSYAYKAGSQPKISLTVKYGKQTLKKDRDYKISYKNSSGAVVTDISAEGSYTLLMTGVGNYTGTRELAFEVLSKIPVSKLKVSKIASLPYDGSPKEPSVTVKYGKATLEKGVDYELSYANNTEAGQAAVIITGKGNYSGNRKVFFTITGMKLSRAKIQGFSSAVEYTGESVVQNMHLTVTVKANGATADKTLKEGTDYQIKYENNTGSGKATMILTGKGGYTGTVKKTFTIKPYDIRSNSTSKFTVSSEAITAPYAKGGARPDVEIRFGGKKLELGKDYTLIYSNNKAVTTSATTKKPSITIMGKGNFKGKLAGAKSFIITKQSLSAVKASADDVVYKDKAGNYKSVPLLYDLDGKKLSAEKDYSKTYKYSYVSGVTLADGTIRSAGDEVGVSDVVPAGTEISMTVTASESAGCNYQGEINAKYHVVPKSLKGAEVKVLNSFEYTGKEVRLTKEDLRVTPKGENQATSSYEILNDTYQNNTKKGRASVQIRGTGDYGGIVTVKYKIKAKTFKWWIARLFS